VSDLTIRTEAVPAFWLANCRLCGLTYRVHGVITVMFWGDRDVGVLCPRCLNRKPTVIAAALRSGRLAPAVAVPARLVDELTDLREWPVSVQDLMAAERDLLRERYFFLTEDDVHLLVDERYEVMLAGPDCGAVGLVR
jgi:hypothetical protein